MVCDCFRRGVDSMFGAISFHNLHHWCGGWQDMYGLSWLRGTFYSRSWVALIFFSIGLEGVCAACRGIQGKKRRKKKHVRGSLFFFGIRSWSFVHDFDCLVFFLSVGAIGDARLFDCWVMHELWGVKGTKERERREQEAEGWRKPGTLPLYHAGVWGPGRGTWSFRVTSLLCPIGQYDIHTVGISTPLSLAFLYVANYLRVRIEL